MTSPTAIATTASSPPHNPAQQRREAPGRLVGQTGMPAPGSQWFLALDCFCFCALVRAPYEVVPEGSRRHVRVGSVGILNGRVGGAARSTWHCWICWRTAPPPHHRPWPVPRGLRDLWLAGIPLERAAAATGLTAAEVECRLTGLGWRPSPNGSRWSCYASCTWRSGCRRRRWRPGADVGRRSRLGRTGPASGGRRCVAKFDHRGAVPLPFVGG